jgi:hypothetical protein
MTGHHSASRLVVVLGVLLVAASLLFAADWSAAAPWSAVAPSPVRPGHPTLAGASGALFRDDFERDAVGANPPAGWEVMDGTWDGVVDDHGRVLRHAAGQSYGHVAVGSPAWRDYSVTARLRLAPLSTGFAGVAARFRDEGDYYACGVYYGTAVRLWRVRGGSVTLLDARRMDVAADRFHDVRLVVKGSRLSCVFDSAEVLTATDDSLPSGRIALVAGSEQVAEFDDVVVRT